MKRKMWMVFSLLLVLGLTLAGCGGRPTADEIVAKMQETAENTEDAHVVMAVDVNAQGIEMTAKAEIWEKAPNKLRAEVLDASESRLAGTVMVSNGQQGWLYEPSRNRVLVGAVAEIETPLPQEMITEMQFAIQQVMEVSDVKLEGEEEVIGRDVYKLTVTPKEDAEKELFPGGGVATLWVDKEQWFILKATYQADAFGQGTMEVQSFELNTGLPDDLFTFVVPEGAEVVDVESQQVTHLTLDEAEAQAEFPLLVPEYVPGDATLVNVFKMGTSFGLHYDHSPLVSFTVFQGSEPADLLPGYDSLEGRYPSKDITVRGQDASAFVDDVEGNTLLYWTEDGVTIMIAGHISLDEALQVAESLK